VAATGARWVGVVAFNLWLLVCGLTALRTGVTRRQLGTVNGGLLALGALVVARFFDAEIPMLVRSTTFIALGIAFLATNLVLVRRFRAAAGRPA
jgi:hypothetical protein